MSDPFIALVDPKRFFPRLRRIFAQLFWSKKEQQAKHWTTAEISEWCKAHFQDEKQLFHFLRIQRRLGRFDMKLSREFKLSVAKPVEYHIPGYFLLRGIKRRKMPSDYQNEK